MKSAPTALIAEDEPLLAHTLAQELHTLWPQLQLRDTAADGLSAVQLALQHLPDVLFMDIRLPGQSGLDAALTLTEQWPAERALPLLVFVTAYDQYAVQAFEAQALDYVLKPVRTERLKRTVQRLQERLSAVAPDDEALLAPLRALLAAQTAGPTCTAPPLKILQASTAQGQQLRMVPVEQVVLLEAADKYVRVLDREGHEFWLRTPLKELIDQLDPQDFWQIHRSTIVRADAIASATRDEQGQWRVQLHGPAGQHKVSRLFAYRFKAM